MSKRQTLMLFGVMVISFLFLGFPAVWDKIIAVFCGFTIIFIALKLKPELITKKYSFVEHKNTEDVVLQKSDVVAPVFDITKTETKVNS